MKKLNQFIIEKLKLSNNIKNYKYYPKNKNELKSLIYLLIKERGMDADLNDIDTSEITDMSFLFSTSSFIGDISGWDVSNVTDMKGMFFQSEFNNDISSWDVSNVESMEGMFMDSEFNQDISSWNLNNIKNMKGMFKGCKFNKDISSWNISENTKTDFIFLESPLAKKPPKWYK